MSSGQSCTMHGFLDVNECDDEDGSEDGNDSDEKGTPVMVVNSKGVRKAMVARMTMRVNVPVSEQILSPADFVPPDTIR